MPRDSSGNYVLPPSNPVVSNTPIQSAGWANPTMSDLGNEITNSLDRGGRGGMTGPFGIQDGTLAAPGLRFTTDPDNGLRRTGVNTWTLVVGGVDVAVLTPTTFTIPAGVNFIPLGTFAYLALTGGVMTGQVTLPGGGSGLQAISVNETNALIAAIPPSVDIPLAQKGAANGVASLDANVKVPQAQLDTTRTWAAPQRATPVVDNDGSFDMNAANDFICTPAGAVQIAFTNPAVGQRGMILLVNTGAHAITSSAAVKTSATFDADMSVAGTHGLSYWSPDGVNIYVSGTEPLL